MKVHAKALIDEMSDVQLRAVSEFLEFVSQRDLDPATVELLSIPGFEKSFEQGMKDIKAGRTKAWRQVQPRQVERTQTREKSSQGLQVRRRV